MELAEIKPGREFEIRVTTVPPLEGVNPQTMITAKTSSTNMPELRLIAMAMVHAPVTATPATIMLPAGPLERPTEYMINVRNNRASLPMQISDVKCSLTNVNHRIQENQANVAYGVFLSFPQGFQMSQGEVGRVVIATTHPRTPQISVNIVQLTGAGRPPRLVVAPPAEVPFSTTLPLPATAPATAVPPILRPVPTNGPSAR